MSKGKASGSTGKSNITSKITRMRTPASRPQTAKGENKVIPPAASKPNLDAPKDSK